MTDQEHPADADPSQQPKPLPSPSSASPQPSSLGAPNDETTLRYEGDNQPTLDSGQHTARPSDEATLPSDSHAQHFDPDGTVDAVSGSSGSQIHISFIDDTLHPASGPVQPASPSLSSQSLGRFRIVRMLGQGAFGAVYLTHDPQLDREVAVKVAKTGMLVTQADRDRFQREARAAARLRHPNIVPVYEYGQLGESSYIAYEYIAGPTLKSELRRRGRLPRQEACQLVAKIADALHYAHTQNIVHRDVKPDNILLDNHGEPHIADFGCARQQDATAGALTVEGSLMGTPAYMSPEQATGYSHQADARSDIWSVGIILEELMSGQRPFSGPVTEILRQISAGDFKGIRYRDPHIPKDLETIWHRCVAQDPDERFQTAEELADELRRWLNGEPIRSRRISLLARTYRWARRNRDIAALIGLVVLVSVTGALVSSLLYLQALRAESRRLQAERERSTNQVAQLRTAEPSELLSILSNLQSTESQRRNVTLTLRQQVGDPSFPSGELTRLRAALLTLDPLGDDRHKLAVAVLHDLLQAPAAEFRLSRAALQLQDVGTAVSSDLWKIAEDPEQSRAERFRALVALAHFDEASPHWSSMAGLACDLLLAEPQSTLPIWAEELRPIREALLVPLRQAFSAVESSARRGVAAALVIGQLFQDRPSLLALLALEAKPAQTAELIAQLRPQAREVLELLDAWEKLGAIEDPYAQAQQAILRMSLGQTTAVQQLPAGVPDAHTAWIHRAAEAGLDPAQLLPRLQIRPPGREIQDIVLAIGAFSEDVLPSSARQRWMPVLESLYREHPDAGVHYAIDWLLRRWGEDSLRDQWRKTWLGSPPPAGRQWFTNSIGIDFAIVEPAEFLMGPKPGETSIAASQPRFPRYVPRRFAISVFETTNRQFLSFPSAVGRDLKQNTEQLVQLAQLHPSPWVRSLALAGADALRRRYEQVYRTETNRGVQGSELPVKNVTWFETIAFCRWLSQQENLDCGFPPLDIIAAVAAEEAPLILDEGILQTPGYRLPTAGEWELACRAGAETIRFTGDRADYLSHYICSVNSPGFRTPVGQFEPNLWGLFDMLGNVDEWCLNNFRPYEDEKNQFRDDAGPPVGALREVRSGSYEDKLDEIRSAYQAFVPPIKGSDVLGFRVVRTLDWEP